MAAEKLLPVADRQVAKLRLADGTDLVADVWRPAGAGRHPVLLMRQPYGRAIASTLTLAHPAWYAAQGYVVVVQDVRGRGDSKGQFRLFETEAEDGAQTLAWAAELAGATGQVAMYGFSYQAVTQFLAWAGAVAAGTKRPDAIVPAMGGWTIRDDWAFVGGAFQLSGNLGWAAQMGAEAARLAGDAAGFQALAAAVRSGVPAGGIAAQPEVMARFGHYTHYADWLADAPAYWAKVAPAQRLADVARDVPGLHVGGWQDFLLDGTLGAYAACAGGDAAQHLLVGPWAHSPWGRRVGALDLGPDAVGAVDAATVLFLDHVLKGQGTPPPPVRLFDVGAKGWRRFEAWPNATPVPLHLVSDGLAATRSSGRLEATPVDGPADWLVHDPWRPAPVLGGPWAAPPGFQDRAALDDRADVAVYQGAPVTQETLLAGRVAATLFVASTARRYDLHATLSLVEPDGRAYGLACGHLRVANDGPDVPRRLALRALCCTLKPGQALRLSIQAAAWPAFAVNPGTGAMPEATPPEQHAIVTLAIRHEPGAHSFVEVPVV